MGVYKELRHGVAGYRADVQVKVRRGEPPVRARKWSSDWSKRQAEEWARDARAKILAGTWGKIEVVPDKLPTLAEWAESFLSVYAQSTNKPSEVAGKKAKLRDHIVPLLGAKRLDEITAWDVTVLKSSVLDKPRYKDRPTPTLSPKTANNVLTVFHKLLVEAKKKYPEIVVPDIEWARVPEQGFRFLSFDETERLLAAAEREGFPWHPMVVLGLKSGLRQGELRAVGIGYEGVDFVAGHVRVTRAFWRNTLGTPKGRRSRTVKISTGTVAALQPYRHLRGEFFFCGEGGRPLTKEECKRPLWRICKRAGLEAFGWHVLRHTFASHLAMRGIPLKAIQELMGHTDMKQTMRYAHLSPAFIEDAVSVLDLPASHGRTEAPRAHETGREAPRPHSAHKSRTTR